MVRKSHITINTRAAFADTSGVPRYVREIASRSKTWIAVHPTSRSGVWGHLWEQLVLLLQTREQVLVSPANTGPLFHKNQVVVIHDTATFDFPSAFSFLFSAWYRLFTPVLAQNARAVVTVSEFSKTRIVANTLVPRSKVRVVLNGIHHPTENAQPSETLQKQLSDLLFSSPFLLLVGSDDPRKNIELVSRQAGEIANRGFKIVWAGGGNRSIFTPTDYSEKIIKLGRVGEADLEWLYSKAAALLFPSKYEGFGLPPLEAMRRGCPAIVSSSTALPEVCGPSYSQGGAVFYFDPNSGASLLKAIDEFSNIDKDTLARRSIEWCSRYSWDSAQAELEEIAISLSEHEAEAETI